MPGLLVEPLRAIEYWSNTIATNITDINLPGFKLRRITFADAGVDITRLPAPTLIQAGSAAGAPVSIMTPTPTLNVASTPVDFSQGSIESTGMNTHFAIKDRPGSPGSNFFVFARDFDDTGAAARTVTYLSRDGEFHWTDRVPPGVKPNPNYFNRGATTITAPPGQRFLEGIAPGPYLVNSYGLYVLGVREFRDTSQISAVADTGAAAGRSLTVFSFISQSFINPPPEFVPPAGESETTLHPLVVNVKFPQNLEFSEFGANVFAFKERTTTGGLPLADVAAGAASLPITSDGYRYSNTNPLTPNASSAANRRVNIYADLVDGALERANYSLMPLFPEMSQIQRTFVSIAKIISVLQQNMDVILDTTR